MSEHIGVTIKKLREERKLSKARLAREAGFSDAYLVQIEKGDRNPSESVLRSLAKALRVPPHALLIPAGCYTEDVIASAREYADYRRERLEARFERPLTEQEYDRLLSIELEQADAWSQAPEGIDLEMQRREQPLSLSAEDFWEWNESRAWAPEHWDTLTKRDRALVQELINRLVELAE